MYNYPKAKTVSQGVEVAVQILETFYQAKKPGISAISRQLFVSPTLAVRKGAVSREYLSPTALSSHSYC
jgi:hypothetical protein